MASHTLLIDGDLLLHRTCCVTEHEIDWGDQVSSIHCDHKEMVALFKRSLDKILANAPSSHKAPLFAFTGEGNFRKELSPDYKANRQGRKPVGFKTLREYIQANHDCRVINGIEADDLLGIMATSGKYPNPCIVSDDKDFEQIPGLWYAPTKGKLSKVSVTDGRRSHLYQTLVGDRADNYPGCPGMGPVAAEKLLAGPEEDWWPSIVAAFEKKGLTEADALLQARLAKILHHQDYDFKLKRPKLWTPVSTAVTGASSLVKPSPTGANAKGSVKTCSQSRASTASSGATSTSPKTRRSSSPTIRSTQATTPSTPSSPSSSSSRTGSPTRSATSSSTSSATKTRTGSKTSRRPGSTST